MTNQDEQPTTGGHLPEWAMPLVTSPSDCVRQRLFALLVLRCVGFLSLVSALLPLLSWLAEGLADRDLLDMSYYAERVAFAVALGGIGFGFVLLAGPISRKLVIVHREPICPGCGFTLTGLTRPKCPECGLQFSKSGSAHVSRHAVLQHRLWLTGTIILFRLVAALILGLGISNMLGYLMWFVDDLSQLLYPLLGAEEAITTVMGLASAFLPGLLLWWLAPILARMCLQAGLKAEIEHDSPAA